MALFSLAARAGIPAARSALRFLSKMKKPSGGGIAVFRGEPAKHVIPKAEMATMYNPRGIGKGLTDFTNPELRSSLQDLRAVHVSCPCSRIQKMF